MRFARLVSTMTLLCLLFCAEIALGAKETFDLEGVSVTLNLPEDWVGAADFMGVPVVAKGPERETGWADISIFPFDQGDEVTAEDAAKLGGTYRQGKEEWLETIGGKFISLRPHRMLRLPGALSGFTIGIRYELDGAQFDLDSYYQACDGVLFLIKTQLPVQNPPADAKAMKSVLDSFTCRRTR